MNRASNPDDPFPPLIPAANVLCLGVSHRTASVEVRERFAVRDAEVAEVTSRLQKAPAITEAVIVSTCNRVEFYTATPDPRQAAAAIHCLLQERLRADLEKHPGNFTGFPSEKSPFYQLDGAAAVDHLFRVASGLDSMVIGETEILGQLKKAYAAATAAHATARNLNKLFQRTFHVAKELRSTTGIARGAVSVGSAAVDLAEKILGKLDGCRVMILGAGETSELTARALRSRGVSSVIVSNRSFDRAAALATEMGGTAIHFDEWDRRFHEIDILISSTSAPHAVVTRAKLAPAMADRPTRPLFIIDLAVPRDVESSVSELENVHLYDIDSLQAIAREGLETRRREIALCEPLIARHVGEFAHWLGSGIPAIHKIA